MTKRTITKAKASTPAKPETSKQSQLVNLLKAPKGCTLDQMTNLTGWQAHTIRAVISSVIRKKLQLDVVCTRTEAGSRYQIAAAGRK
jgi:Protein of unknown function (DUF3489)